VVRDSAKEVEGAVKAIRLKRMCEDEYRTYRDAAVRGYAEDKQCSGDWVSQPLWTMNGGSLMAVFMKLAATIASVFLLCAVTSRAMADAVLIPLDGSDKSVKPADFGYQVNMSIVNRQAVIRILLSEDAAKSFGFGRLTLTKGHKAVVETTLGLDRHADGKKGVLTLKLDAESIDGGELILWSADIKGQPPVINFGGFRLSIQTVLAQAREAAGK
jgi:hypothetical protein